MSKIEQEQGRIVLRLAATLLVLASLVALGCGDDRDESTGEGKSATVRDVDNPGNSAGLKSDNDSASGGDDIATSSLTKAQYVKRAVAICEAVKKQAISALENYVKEQDVEAEGKGLSRATRIVVVPRIEAQVEELEELGVPKGDEDEISKFLAAMHTAIEKETSGSPVPEQAGEAFTQSARMADRYGIEECGFA